MSKPTRIALVGATGLIGMSLIRLAVNRPDIRIIGISRREVPLPPGARMEVLLADPSGWGDAIAAANADVLVCALGTTWKKAGKDEAAFRSVDQDLVLECGRAAKAAGVRQMIAVSSIGADPLARNFYLRVKGETEQALGKLGIPRLDVIRPGLLRGPRGELRPAEKLAMIVSPLTDLLMQGQYSKYRSIRSETVAEAIVGLTREKMAGRFVFEHEAILRAARKGQSVL
ncbi:MULTISPECIES: NAD(P)H-binding protein [unclassified Novosphingobium]|uniref:NAD(P)H-binding protein n=1 Tax=unclassified Novosphingobium TaxID=2644732 RepID=UPI0025FE9AE4|nr:MULTISPECIES: NAD(P)H-binding protein [unclassified Novosphingobium]HQV04035.1 NAD(P)H-binding protein [Novosphingobium sp.]